MKKPVVVAVITKIGTVISTSIRRGLLLHCLDGLAVNRRAAHAGFLALAATMAGLALAGAFSQEEALSVGAQTLALAAFSVLLLERVLIALYAWPLKPDSLAEGYLLRRPALAFGVAAVVHFATTVSVEAAVLTRSALVPLPLRGLVGFAILLAALPFWFVALHPVAFFRFGKAMKTPREPLATRAARIYADVTAGLARILTMLTAVSRHRSTRRERDGTP
jgi:hypothetical protein